MNLYFYQTDWCKSVFESVTEKQVNAIREFGENKHFTKVYRQQDLVTIQINKDFIHYSNYWCVTFSF